MRPVPEVRLDRIALHDAFAGARFAEVANAIDAEDEPPAWAVVLRARVELRRDPAAAAGRLAAAHALFVEPQDRAAAALVAGIAASRLRDHRAAVAAFRTAERLDRPRALRGEILYRRAADRWIARDLPKAEELATELVAIELPAPLALEVAILRGAIAATRGDLAGQAAILLAARPLTSEPARCALAHAMLTAQLATLARELPGDAARDAARVEIDRVAWSVDLADQRFVALRSLGFRDALDGDDFGAFRRLRMSAEIAPSAAWRVTALCDRAYLARALGEPRWGLQELRDARELAERIDWRTTTGEERHGLLLLAERSAENDPVLALSYLATYRGIGARYDATLAAAGDRRLEALESYATGVVRAALGETELATSLLRTAWEIYDGVGYRWRASRAASRLAETTNDPLWQRRAGEGERLYPASWLAQPSPVPAAVHRLTPAQREIYDRLLAGFSVAQIAAEQGRSVFTVRNHVKVVLRVFAVNSIAQLIAAGLAPRRTDATRGEDS